MRGWSSSPARSPSVLRLASLYLRPRAWCAAPHCQGQAPWSKGSPHRACGVICCFHVQQTVERYRHTADRGRVFEVNHRRWFSALSTACGMVSSGDQAILQKTGQKAPCMHAGDEWLMQGVLKPCPFGFHSDLSDWVRARAASLPVLPSVIVL